MHLTTAIFWPEKMVFIFGVGGGSDVYSAQLVAAQRGDTCFVIFTSFRPIMRDDGSMDLDETVKKYTGRPYCDKGIQRERNPQYEVWAICDDVHSSIQCLKHAYLKNIFGILVPPHSCTTAFTECSSAVVRLISSLPGKSISDEVLAVDTGGDCLRNWVPGVGDRDLSHVYDGEVDTRDHDTLLMISSIFQVSKIRTIILGPGSDGETTSCCLVSGLNFLTMGTNSVSLIKVGNMSEYEPLFYSIPEWNAPMAGSTISNIRNALKSPLGGDEMSQITRRGNMVVGSVPSCFLRAYWVVDICTT